MSKVKLKIPKSVSRRFKISAGGKLISGHSFNRHLGRKKRKSAQRRLDIPKVHEGKYANKIKKALGAA